MRIRVSSFGPLRARFISVFAAGIALLLSACATQPGSTTSASTNGQAASPYQKVLELLDDCPRVVSAQPIPTYSPERHPFELASFVDQKTLQQLIDIKKQLIAYESSYYPNINGKPWGEPYRQCDVELSNQQGRMGAYERLYWSPVQITPCMEKWLGGSNLPSCPPGYLPPSSLKYDANIINWPLRSSFRSADSQNVGALSQAIADHLHGRILFRGIYLETPGSLEGGDGALILLPDGISHVLVWLQERSNLGKRKYDWDRIYIRLRQFPDRYWPAATIKNIHLYNGGAASNCELYDCFVYANNGLPTGVGNSWEHTDVVASRQKFSQAAATGMATMKRLGDEPMPPYPLEISKKILNIYATHFIKDRAAVDAARKEKGRIQKRESDALQRRLEGGKSWSQIISETLPGAMADVQRDWNDTNRVLQQSWESNTSRVGTGGGYTSTYTPPDLSKQTAAEKEKAAEEKRERSFAAEQWTKYRQCKSSGNKWVGGKNEYVIGGYCDRKTATYSGAKNATNTASAGSSFDKEQTCYAKGRDNHVFQHGECIKLGPVQNEAWAYCWPTKNKRGWYCDGPVQLLQAAEGNLETALKRVGCETGTRDNWNSSGDSVWYRCSFGLETYDRDTWKIRKGSENRGALQYRCRDLRSGRCKQLITNRVY